MELSDEAAIRRCLEGDRDAFSLLIEKYQNAVYGLCYHMVSNFADAQDLTQEAFVRAYLDLAKIREPSKFASWLNRLTANVCRMWLRERRRFDSLPLEAAAPMVEWPGNSASPAEHAENEELRIIINAAIASLSEKNRLTVTLYYIDGLSHEEIGNFLESSPSAVKSRLHRARKQLREELVSMVEEEFGKHKLPEDFPERVIQEVEIKSVLAKLKAGEQRPSGSGLVLQSKADEKQLLIIYTGYEEGGRVLEELERQPSRAPSIFDFMTNILSEFDMEIVKVIVVDRMDGTFHARTIIRSNGVVKEINTRASDSIALALRTGAPIFVVKSIWNEHGVDEIPEQIQNEHIIGSLPGTKDVRVILRRQTDSEKQPSSRLFRMKISDRPSQRIRMSRSKYEKYEVEGIEYAGEKLPLLFSIDPKFLSDVYSANISEELRQEFEDNGVSLSHRTSSSGSMIFLAPLLFTIDLKFRGDLDNSDMSAELRQEFESNGFPLSQDITFVAQQKKDLWLMRDGYKEYHIKASEIDIEVYIVRYRVWNLNDEDNDKKYLVLGVDGELGAYSIPFLPDFDSYVRESKKSE